MECLKCGLDKPPEEMVRDSRYRSGYRRLCRACKNGSDWRRNGGPKPSHTFSRSVNVLSLGAGVQSSVLLMMSELGLLPKLDAAVFADTQWEPRAVYEHLDWLEAHTSIPIIRVTAGNLRASVVGDGFVPIPAFTSKGILRRQCTSQYKIRPIRSALLDLVERKHRTTQVRLWLGISLDEVERMRDSDVGWIANHYPLIDLGWRREQCLSWWQEQGYPPLPRSACIGCPFRSDADWMALTPDEFADAAAVDIVLRDALPDLGDIYLHHSRTSLFDAKFEKHQGMWSTECAGVCGV